VLKSFEKESGGVGGVLNTSFNIHGEAIVRTPFDALDTFLNSGLDGLAIGDYYVKKIMD
jgi:carbamoyltransferase